MPDLYTKYQYNDEGDLIDPPRIPDFERQLIEAGALGDTGLIESLTADYEEKRKSMAERHNKRVDERANEDKRLLAERDERARAESQAQSNARAETLRREAADNERTAAAERASQPAQPQEGNPAAAPSPTAEGAAGIPGSGGVDTGTTSTGEPTTTVGGENP